MIVVTLARKPLDQPTVAANVLEHSIGALDIDASRVGLSRIQQAAGGLGDGTIYGTADTYEKGTGREYRVGGRWPANLILQHTPECRQLGTKRVKASTQGHGDSTPYGSETTWSVSNTTDNQRNRWHADADGKEAVAVWQCTPACPVHDLDEQSGDRPVSGAARLGKAVTANPGPSIVDFGSNHGTGTMHNDSGTAARFFKQVR